MLLRFQDNLVSFLMKLFYGNGIHFIVNSMTGNTSVFEDRSMIILLDYFADSYTNITRTHGNDRFCLRLQTGEICWKLTIIVY